VPIEEEEESDTPRYDLHFFHKYFLLLSSHFIALIPVSARSKAWVCGRSPAAIAGSNSTGGMDVYLL